MWLQKRPRGSLTGWVSARMRCIPLLLILILVFPTNGCPVGGQPAFRLHLALRWVEVPLGHVGLDTDTDWLEKQIAEVP